MPEAAKPKVALVWSQFAPYHVDRCEAVARRLGDRAELLAVEIASSSQAYAWEVSGDIAGMRKVTLFPGKDYEDQGWVRRIRAQFGVLRRCDFVLSGMPVSEVDCLVLSWILPFFGAQVVLMSDSKFDDAPRKRWREWIKRILLSGFGAAIVSGTRSAQYYRHLGFKKRPVVPGYDTVGLERIQGQGWPCAPWAAPFASRDFIYVGRFVAKKNIEGLLEGYALYIRNTFAPYRRLVLVGDGPLVERLRQLSQELGISDRVEFTGFLQAEAIAQRLAASLALVLVSKVEQWGLVVNEALAFGLPVIVSTPVGARDALVRDGENGLVVDPASPAAIADAMIALSQDEGRWKDMAAASHARAWMGDSERFADAMEVLLDPGAAGARARIARFVAQMELA